MTAPSNASAEERQAWERLCVETLRTLIERHGCHNQRVVSELSIRSQYPESELVVSFTEPSGRPGESRYSLWTDDPPHELTESEAHHIMILVWVDVAGM